MNARRLGFSLFILAMVAVLVGLGLWQLQRRAEKRALIAALDERLALAPVPLPPSAQWSGLRAGTDEFRRVRLSAVKLDLASGGRVYGSGSAVRDDISGPGKWQFVPAQLESGEVVAVNIGFAQDPAPNAPAGEARNQRIVVRYPLQLTGYLRFPEPAGMFTPAGNVGQLLWFTRDHPAMARALGWDRDGRTVAPFYVDLESPALLDGVKPGPLRVRLKDDHLQYAITWFGLAAVVLIAFGFWLRAQRR
jgi:cytochrome oxidase assembly protein ShyY1